MPITELSIETLRVIDPGTELILTINGTAELYDVVLSSITETRVSFRVINHETARSQSFPIEWIADGRRSVHMHIADDIIWNFLAEEKPKKKKVKKKVKPIKTWPVGKQLEIVAKKVYYEVLDIE